MTAPARFTVDRSAPFYVAGHRGLVGSAILRQLQKSGFSRLIGRSSSEIDLRNREQVFSFFAQEKPRYAMIAAAKVGGIMANSTFPADFLSDNLRIQINILDAAIEHGVERLLFLGSSCIYPRMAPQPLKEQYLMSGALEPTNEGYAIAKIAGILHIQSLRKQYGVPWISAMPTNLYGPGDNFSSQNSHVLPALIRRYSDALENRLTSVTNWGSGTPRREFMHVDDMARACLFLLENYDDSSHVNIGTGTDVTIEEVSRIIADEVGYNGSIMWDTSKPDGTPRKLLDVNKIERLGWTSRIDLQEGIASTVKWYRAHKDTLRE